MPPPAQLARDARCGPLHPCQAAGSALGDGVGAALWGLEGGAGKCFPLGGGLQSHGRRPVSPIRPPSRADPDLAILSLRSTLKAEHTAPSQSHPPGRRGPPYTLSQTREGLPPRLGLGVSEAAEEPGRKQAARILSEGRGKTASALDLKLETVGVGITTSGDNPSCHRELQPAPAPRLSPSNWALLLLP